MSAKKAAQALLDNDTTLAEQVAAFEASNVGMFERTDAVMKLLREIAGTWTLTLAAQAAGVTEEQVIAALAYHPRLRIGTTCVAQGIAREIFRDSSTHNAELRGGTAVSSPERPA